MAVSNAQMSNKATTNVGSELKEFFLVIAYSNKPFPYKTKKADAPAKMSGLSK
jgi:hypothetical protein